MEVEPSSSTTFNAPIQLRQNSTKVILFGLPDCFQSTYPARLGGKIAPEEFSKTINHVNEICKNDVSASFKLFFGGFVFCCCTCGLSFFPSYILQKHIVNKIQKFLDSENARLYHKIGAHWKIFFDTTLDQPEYMILIQLNVDPKLRISELLVPE